MSNGLPDWCIAHDQPWGHPTDVDPYEKPGDIPKDGHCELGMRPDRLLTRAAK